MEGPEAKAYAVAVSNVSLIFIQSFFGSAFFRSVRDRRRSMRGMGIAFWWLVLPCCFVASLTGLNTDDLSASWWLGAYLSAVLCFLSAFRVLVVIRSWIEQHHFLDQEPHEASRLDEFLKYIKSPDNHVQLARKMIGLIAKVS